MSNAKSFVLILILSACLCSVSSAGIRELTFDEKSHSKYSQAEFVIKYKLNIQKTFLWTVGHDQGILLMAQSADAQDSKECSILSWKNGHVKLVGGSQSLHSCHWIKKQPLYFSKGKKAGLRFYNEVDISGYEIHFSPDYIELLFDKKNKEFCMMDYFSDAKPKCTVF
jgi:hypothetical protein